MKSWLEINTFYRGIAQAINECAGEAVLVTTKQQRFATALVRHAGITNDSMPDNQVYGLGMYKSKSDVIADRMKNGGYEVWTYKYSATRRQMEKSACCSFMILFVTSFLVGRIMVVRTLKERKSSEI